MGSLRRRAARVVLAVAVLLAVLGPLALWLRDSSLVRVEQVTVTGLDGRKSAAIRRALVDAATGMTTLHVREDALRSAVSSYPIVRSLRTETDVPHGLRVIVEAYDPIAALRSAGGTLTPVAADGTLLRGSSTRGLPVVGIRSTPPGGHLAEGTGLKAVRLLAAAPRALRSRVARVYNGPRGLAATMHSGPKLYFGGSGELEAKWGAAAAVLGSSTSRGAAYLDLRIPGRPVAGGLQPRAADPQAPL